MNDKTMASSIKAETHALQLGPTVAKRRMRPTFMGFDLALDLEHLEFDSKHDRQGDTGRLLCIIKTN
jgi:hypothetical protein